MSGNSHKPEYRSSMVSKQSWRALGNRTINVKNATSMARYQLIFVEKWSDIIPKTYCHEIYQPDERKEIGNLLHWRPGNGTRNRGSRCPFLRLGDEKAAINTLPASLNTMSGEEHRIELMIDRGLDHELKVDWSCLVWRSSDALHNTSPISSVWWSSPRSTRTASTKNASASPAKRKATARNEKLCRMVLQQHLCLDLVRLIFEELYGPKKYLVVHRTCLSRVFPNRCTSSGYLSFNRVGSDFYLPSNRTLQYTSYIY